MIGETNASDVVILGGLAGNDQVYLSIPFEMEHEQIVLLKEMEGKRKRLQPSEEPKNDEAASGTLVPASTSGN